MSSQPQVIPVLMYVPATTYTHPTRRWNNNGGGGGAGGALRVDPSLMQGHPQFVGNAPQQAPSQQLLIMHQGSATAGNGPQQQPRQRQKTLMSASAFSAVGHQPHNHHQGRHQQHNATQQQQKSNNNYEYVAHVAEYEAENPQSSPIEFRLKHSGQTRTFPDNVVRIKTVKRSVDIRNGCVWLEVELPVKGYVPYALDRAVKAHYSPETVERKSPWKLLKMHTNDDHDTQWRAHTWSLLKWATRINNCIPPDCRVLFHQTSPDAAKAILKDKTMLRGSGGLAGGAIYFACSEAETQVKAHNHGAMLRCVVYVGRQKEMTKQQVSNDKPIFTTLRNDGYDSIRIVDTPTGVEHVVYNRDQVIKINRIK